MGPDDAAQQLGDRAGMRFAEAALALAAGNLFLYTRWLPAAEATAKLVELTTPRGRSTAEPKLTFSAAYSESGQGTEAEVQSTCPRNRPTQHSADGAAGAGNRKRASEVLKGRSAAPAGRAKRRKAK
jgi:hypothetical protein